VWVAPRDGCSGALGGTRVLWQEAGGGFATRAEVRGVSAGPSGAHRLHLRFLDRQAPDRLLRQ